MEFKEGDKVLFTTDEGNEREGTILKPENPGYFVVLFEGNDQQVIMKSLLSRIDG